MTDNGRDQRRDVSRSQFRDQTFIAQGNIHGSVYYHPPHQPAPAAVVRVIPYPRNEDMVALDYAYRRCDNDKDCCVFWVHADSEATFTSDYKAIGKKLGVDDRLDGSDLLDAVCSKMGERSAWVMILDNADNLGLFGVGPAQQGTNESLRHYIPHASQGTLLWTSRDEHITGTLIGSRRGIEVLSMVTEEATTLLARVRDNESTFSEAGVDALLEELQRLPLAISQAGAYIRRMSISVEDYLYLLKQGKTRWEVLKMSDTDRHRRPEVSNSVLETWRISIERIRAESEMSYRILHVIAYVDSQDIPYDLMATASRHSMVDEDYKRALRLRQQVVGEKHPDTIRSMAELAATYHAQGRYDEAEGICWEVLDLRREVVGEKHPDTIRSMADLATTYHSQGRYDAAEGICREVLDLRREVIGEKHPDTIKSMAELAATYHAQGRYDEAEDIYREVLRLRREVVGEKHPDTIRSMADLATTYHNQGRYDAAETLKKRALDLRREVVGEKHPDTISSMASLAATTYHAQGRYDEAEDIYREVLRLRREV
ncbi:Nephrocystin-3, partial [Emericellopsis cladophorae]